MANQDSQPNQSGDRERHPREDPDHGLEGRRLFLSGEDEWNAEFGGDYEFGFGPGRLKATYTRALN